ncbi:hypothetical protein ACFFVK_15955 [Flavobacterium gyeonganense]|uniref:Lipoprotein n=1 Tax=Flavobacterium gyeonganense TaxID=1310418 RepID=A0ABV5HEJ0_9FLAO
MSSCNSSNATDFKESLDQSERKAFNIIVGKKGSGEKKLEYLEKEDYKNAIKAVDQQAIDFDIIIADIHRLPADDIPEGQQLKTASLEYYQSLKELHIFDKKDIEQQALLKTLKKDELEDALNKLKELAQQKKMLYNALYKKEALLYTATQRFKAANGI